MVRGWLDNCVANHPKCNTAYRRIVYRPTRLIDIEKYSEMFCVVPGHETKPETGVYRSELL